MGNKIMMMVLLCALLVGLVPPSSAHAEEVYDGPELNIYNSWEDIIWQYPDFEKVKTYLDENDMGLDVYPYEAVFTERYNGNARIKVMRSDSPLVIYKSGNYWRIGAYNDSAKVICYQNWYGSSDISINTDWIYLNLDGYKPGVFYSSHDIYFRGTQTLWHDGIDIVGLGYTFATWCSDAGLNCAPSSYDLGLIKYGYEGYMHIVRRTSSGKYGRWVLTTIGNSVYADNAEDFTVMVDENGQLGVWCLYSGEEVSGYQLFVRNYVYDTDGWRLMSYELFDVKEDDDYIIELGEDSSINDYSLLAYSSVDIYSSGLYLTYPASTEFVDVNDVFPDVPEQPEEPEEPSVTPTVAPLPTVAPPISAGQATVTKNRTAIYEEPSSTSQVQHYLFEGGVVYVVEEYGEDWYYVRYDMGGLSYTGYVAQDNVNYDVENGFASEDVIAGYEGQVDDLLGMVGNVPKMIYALFSFLPPWCLALVGVSFTAMLAVIGWKLLRG